MMMKEAASKERTTLLSNVIDLFSPNRKQKAARKAGDLAAKDDAHARMAKAAVESVEEVALKQFGISLNEDEKRQAQIVALGTSAALQQYEGGEWASRVRMGAESVVQNFGKPKKW